MAANHAGCNAADWCGRMDCPFAPENTESKQGPEGPAIWIDPEPPADYTYKPVDTSALLAFLQPVKAGPVVSGPARAGRRAEMDESEVMRLAREAHTTLAWFDGWSRGLPLEQQPREEVWREQMRITHAAIDAALAAARRDAFEQDAAMLDEVIAIIRGNLERDPGARWRQYMLDALEPVATAIRARALARREDEHGREEIDLRVQQRDEARAEVERLRMALQQILRWELPPAWGRDGKPSLYEVEYGSIGAREFIRDVARKALRE